MLNVITFVSDWSQQVAFTATDVTTDHKYMVKVEGVVNSNVPVVIVRVSIIRLADGAEDGRSFEHIPTAEETAEALGELGHIVPVTILKKLLRPLD